MNEIIDTVAEPGFEARYFTCQDGLSLFYRDYPARSDAPRSHGKHTPVVCLPGLTRNSHDFHHVAQRLSAARRVICPDYRGRGMSARDPDWRRYIPQTYLNDVDQLLTALNLHQVIILGTSLGGVIGMAFGAAKPTRLRAVILNDVGPTIGGGGIARILKYVGSDDPQPDWSSAKRRTQEIFSDLSAPEDRWQAITRGTFVPGQDGMLHVAWDTNIVKPFQEAAKRPPVDLWPYFRSLRKLPVLTLRGAKSDILAPETLEAMADTKPDLDHVTVPDVGHVPTLEEDVARAALERFLDRVETVE